MSLPACRFPVSRELTRLDRPFKQIHHTLFIHTADGLGQSAAPVTGRPLRLLAALRVAIEGRRAAAAALPM